MASLEDLKLVSSGKVREIYEAGDQELIMVASDRISAFDVVLPEPIPDKGKVLTQMSNFWFETTGDIVPNHLIDEDVPEEVAGRAIRVKKLQMYPVECVVRGYISGSGWKEYQQSGSVCGIDLPDGLQESDQLPEPIFTPTTKGEIGEHDEAINFEQACEIVGDRALMEELRRISIELYEHGRTHAYERGIILADTKFELGSTPGAEIVLGDEAMTPDSSRFWAVDDYEPGRGQVSFDKQPVRDFLAAQDWDKEPPAPPLTDEVIAGTTERYREAYKRITGRDLD
jgi:phosphoribosylaminoimidazole-succinocarboxamide synthase